MGDSKSTLATVCVNLTLRGREGQSVDAKKSFFVAVIYKLGKVLVNQ